MIVITTNKGAFNRPLKVSFNSSVNVGARPDLYAVPRMSSADYISIEKRLFSQGFFDNVTDPSAEGHPALSPVVELLLAEKNGTLSAASAGQQIDALSKLDVRGDLDKYFTATAPPSNTRSVSTAVRLPSTTSSPQAMTRTSITPWATASAASPSAPTIPGACWIKSWSSAPP